MHTHFPVSLVLHSCEWIQFHRMYALYTTSANVFSAVFANAVKLDAFNLCGPEWDWCEEKCNRVRCTHHRNTTMFDFVKQTSQQRGWWTPSKCTYRHVNLSESTTKVNVHKEHLFWWFDCIRTHGVWVCESVRVCEWRMTIIYINKSIDWHTH